MRLNDLIGSQISLLIPRAHKTKHQNVKLLGVEVGGIWIESPQLTKRVLQQIGVPASDKTIVLFLPYHEIALGLTAVPPEA